jgi:hypothetical protein
LILDAAGAARLAAARFPALAPLLASLGTGVQRSDLGRLLLLAAFGGVYVDVDASPVPGGDLGALLAAHAAAPALFFEEALLTPAAAAAAGREHPIRGGRPEARTRIANYFMASTGADAAAAAASSSSSAASASAACRGAAVLRILEEVAARVQQHPLLSPRDAEYEVLFTTGPDAVTEAVHALMGWSLEGGDIVGTLALEPLAKGEILTAVRRGEGGGARCLGVVPRPLDQRYFAHAAEGTWKGARSL